MKRWITGSSIRAESRIAGYPVRVTTVDVSTIGGLRDRAIILCVARLGLRDSEVVALRLEDVDWEQDLLYVRRVKRRKVQTYPLVASVGAAIARYLREIRPAQDIDVRLLVSTSAK